jgi:hypothetical protein
MTDDEFIASFEDCSLANESFHHSDHVRMARSGCEQTWGEFATGNGDLLEWKDNVLKKYYRGETLSSELARNTFLFPDKGVCGE